MVVTPCALLRVMTWVGGRGKQHTSRRGVPTKGHSAQRHEAEETQGSRQKARTHTAVTDEAAGAAAPRTASSGDKRRPHVPNWSIRGGSSSRSRTSHQDEAGGKK